MDGRSINAKQRFPFISSRQILESKGRRFRNMDKGEEKEMLGWLFAIIGVPTVFLLLACGLEWMIEHD